MNLAQFESAIENRTLCGAYLLYGVEEFTKQETVARVLDLLSPELREINHSGLDEPNWESLLAAAAQLPFFDDRRILSVSNFSEKELNDAAQPRIRQGNDPYQTLFGLKDTIVLFIRRGEGQATEFKKRFEAADRAIAFAPITEADAVHRIMRLAALRFVTVSKSTALTLVQQVGTDGFRLNQEVEKLCSFVGKGGTVTEETLKTLVTPNIEYRAFDILDAFLSGNRFRGMVALERVLRCGEAHPLQVAAFLEGRLKLILIAREMLDRGRSQKDIAARIGGKPYAVEQTIRQAKRRSTAELRKAVAAFADIQPKLVQGLLKDEEALTLAVYHAFS